MSKILGWMGAVALGVTVAAAPAAAQIEAGDKSVGLQALVVTTTGDESFTFGMGYFSYNKFQTRNFAWRVNSTIQASKFNEESSTSFGPGAGIEWNFNEKGKTTIPFVALDGTYFTGEGANLTLISPSAGFRSFLSRSTSLDVALSYNIALTGEEKIGIVMARLGFSYYLGKDPRR